MSTAGTFGTYALRIDGPGASGRKAAKLAAEALAQEGVGSRKVSVAATRCQSFWAMQFWENTSGLESPSHRNKEHPATLRLPWQEGTGSYREARLPCTMSVKKNAEGGGTCWHESS